MKKTIQTLTGATTFCFATILASQALVAKPSIPSLDWWIETVSAGHGFTEGPAIAEDGSVYFSDLDNSRILRYSPESETTTTWNDDSRNANGLLVVGGTLYACEASGRSVSRYSLKQGPTSREVLATRFEGKRFGSPNDLALVDEQLVFSSFYWKGILKPDDTLREIESNACYTLSLGNHAVRRVPHKFLTPNGVVYDPIHKYLYFGDMKANQIFRAEVSNGQMGPLNLFFDLESIGKGRPDGMAVDRDGRLYVALYGMSNELLILSPEATPIGTLPTGSKTSNCAFAPDRKTLYITAEHQLKKVVIPFL